MTNNPDDSSTEEAVEIIDKEIVKELENQQHEQMTREINKLEKILKSKGSAARVFTLKGDIVGSKKSSQEATAINHPKQEKC